MKALFGQAFVLCAGASGISGRDPMAVFLAPEVEVSVPRKEIRRGGPPVDGIPALDFPRRSSASEGDRFLSGSDEVLGIAHGGEAVAYPIRLLNWHEIVNDTIGGLPVAVTFCPLCGTGIVFSRVLNGKELFFGVSGLLYNSDMLMYDRRTLSLWIQIPGKAVSGPLSGKALRRLPVTRLSWKAWKKKHPKTEAVGFRTGFQRRYGADPYQGYADTPETFFPVKGGDARLPRKERVFGVAEPGLAVAVEIDRLRREKEIRRSFGKRNLRFVWDGGPAAFEGEKKLPGFGAFWFAWSSFFPESELLLDGNESPSRLEREF